MNTLLKTLVCTGQFITASLCLTANVCHANVQSSLEASVNAQIAPLMQKYNMAGVAVAVSVKGKNYFYNYGVASKATQQAVTNSTLFEIGSISKTFTATLATYAQVNEQLVLTNNVSEYLPNLQGSAFDYISLLNLGTHSAGDFPLQAPEPITNIDQLMDYYKHWQPALAVGSHRTYSNLSIGLLGVITAQQMQMPFTAAMENLLLPKLGLHNTYVKVPSAQMALYAQGYNKADEPVRVNPGILDNEAYGLKTSSSDLIRFVNANMGLAKLDKKLQRALTDTHRGYYEIREFTQSLIWEQYPGNASLENLIAGNSTNIIFESVPATPLNPPLPPLADVYINKTGSTNGFGAYVLYNPAKKIGVVILANKSYPNTERARVGYEILQSLQK